MAKSVKSLTGPEKDAYLRRALAAEPGVPPATATRIARKLERDLTRVWVRSAALDAADKPGPVAEAQPAPSLKAAEAARLSAVTHSKLKVRGAAGKGATAPQSATAAPSARSRESFDPFSPNVIVVLRKSGRERVLEALAAIRETDHLRLLAREQQLGIAQDLETADEIRIAIVTAAERRVANRRAAGS